MCVSNDAPHIVQDTYLLRDALRYAGSTVDEQAFALDLEFNAKNT